MDDAAKTEQVRLPLVDAWRVFAMALMLVYHAAYDLSVFGVLPENAYLRPWALALRYACAGSFLLLSGACARLGRDPVRRGFVTLCAALVVSVATALAGVPVRFGILHLLGLCQIGYGLLRDKVKPPLWLGPALFLLTLPLLRKRVDVEWLYPLGLRSAAFSSGDYWPLLPWAFLFLTGTALTPLLARLPRPRLPGWVSALARRSLLFYLLHQPVLYGLCLLLFGRK